MAKFPIDLSKFKKISTNGKNTILSHPSGHRFIVSHRALSPEMRDQLHSLPFAEAQEKINSKSEPKMEKGEEVQESSPPKVHSKQAYADGGEVEDKPLEVEPLQEAAPSSAPQEVDLNALDAQNRAPAAEAAPVAAPQAAPAPKDPELLKKYQIYNQLKSGPSGRGLYHDPKNFFGPNGEAPASGQLDTEAWAKTEQMYNADKVADQAKQQAGAQDMQANNAARQSAGLPPLPTGAAVNQEKAAPGPALEATAGAEAQAKGDIATGQPVSQPQAPKSVMDDPYEAYKQGLGSAMSAERGLGQVQGAEQKQEAQVLDQAQQHYQDIQNNYTKEWQHIEDTRKGIQQQIESQQIDPNQYFKQLGVGGNIATAIGIILGGIGAGMTHSENAALKFVNAQIDRSIETQKAELGKKESLLSSTMKQFGNLHDATSMAKTIMTDMVSHQLLKAGAQAGSQAAQLKAQKAAAELQMGGAQQLPQLAMRRAMLSMMNNQGKPQSLGDQLNAMRWINPEMAKDMEQRYIKVGDQEILSTAPMPGEVKQQIIAGVDAETKLSKLEQFAEQYGNVKGALDPATVARGKALSADAQSAVRQAQHQGVYKESEAKFMGNILDADPTKLLGKIRTLPGYKVARESNRSSLKTIMTAYGAQMPNSLQRFQMAPPVKR